MNFKRYTYEEWLKHNNLTEKLIECDECEGTGINEYNNYCDCHSCMGHIEEEKCESCKGTGQIDQTFREYNDQYTDDSLLLERYRSNIRQGV